MLYYLYQQKEENRIMNRNTKSFVTEIGARIQARALAMFYPKGRHVVIQTKKRFEVAYDECIKRDGIDESHILASFASNANSGTKTYSECLAEAKEVELGTCQ